MKAPGIGSGAESGSDMITGMADVWSLVVVALGVDAPTDAASGNSPKLDEATREKSTRNFDIIDFISSLPSATEQQEPAESTEIYELRLEVWASNEPAFACSAPLLE